MKTLCFMMTGLWFVLMVAFAVMFFKSFWWEDTARYTPLVLLGITFFCFLNLAIACRALDNEN